MTLPAKGRRTITVDGVRFYYQVPAERSDRIVIQDASGRGAFLFIFPFAIMKPAQIAEAIRFGLSRGWIPGQPGTNFWMAFDFDSAGRPLFEWISNSDFRVVTYPTKGQLPESLDRSSFSDTRKWYERPLNKGPQPSG